MYKIMKGTEVLTVTERPNYVRKQTNGCYVLASEEYATGVVVDGCVYSIDSKLPNRESVSIVFFDNGPSYSAAQQLRADVDYIAIMTGVELV